MTYQMLVSQVHNHSFFQKTLMIAERPMFYSSEGGRKDKTKTDSTINQN